MPHIIHTTTFTSLLTERCTQFPRYSLEVQILGYKDFHECISSIPSSSYITHEHDVCKYIETKRTMNI